MKSYFRELPGGPVVSTVLFHCRGHGPVPDQETKILPAVLTVWPKTRQNKTKSYFKDIFYRSHLIWVLINIVNASSSGNAVVFVLFFIMGCNFFCFKGEKIQAKHNMIN